jgi:hypothetical protein
MGWVLPVEGVDEFVNSQSGFGNQTSEGASSYLVVVRYGECCDMSRLRQDNMTAPLSGNRPSKLLKDFDDFGGSEQWNGGHLNRNLDLFGGDCQWHPEFCTDREGFTNRVLDVELSFVLGFPLTHTPGD